MYVEEIQGTYEHCKDDKQIFCIYVHVHIFLRDCVMILIRMSNSHHGQRCTEAKGSLNSVCQDYTSFHYCMILNKLLFWGLKLLICNSGIETVPMSGVAVQSKGDNLRCASKVLQTIPWPQLVLSLYLPLFFFKKKRDSETLFQIFSVEPSDGVGPT